MYYLVYGLFFLISLLPMPVLYFFSSCLYVLLYYIAGYRKKVVIENLAIAFPEKTPRERISIAKEFYRNFTDNFMETLKLLSASPSFIEKSFTLDNPQLIEAFYDEGKKCQVHLGHTFNWEIANAAIPLHARYLFLVVYMPVTSKIFDRLFMKMRGRTGSVLLPATDLSRAIIAYRQRQYLLTLVADQAPANPQKSYWLNFFGRPAPFMQAPEKGARISDIPVLFSKIYKVKRGQYRATMAIGAESPASLPVGELTLRYKRFLEQAIREHPASWLWSHKRWKHAWKNEYGKNWIGDGFPAKEA